MSAISDKYEQLANILGQPQTDEEVCPDGIGHYRHYQGGSLYSFPKIAPFQIFYNPNTGDHFYSTEFSLAINPPVGYNYERPSCYVPLEHKPGTVPLHRFYSDRDHFYTIAGSNPPPGYTYEGVCCYVFPTQVAESVPLHRFYNNNTTDHFYVTDYQPGANPPPGYVYEKIECYVNTVPGDFVTCCIKGAIKQKWASLGWENCFLGYPITDELTTPDGQGRFNHFQRGSIYWTPQTGPHEVHGAIRDKWKSIGWERSLLHYPTTDEETTPDQFGRYTHFQGGSIYWTQDTGAHEVHGAIMGKWSSLGWETSLLGYPTTDETITPDGIGRYNHFQGGSIYFTPQTGAHEVHGAILNTWSTLGWERSYLGYPISDELGSVGGLRCQRFQHGSIIWTPERGILEVPGEETHYLIGIDRIFIDEARSLLEDTDHAKLTIKVGNTIYDDLPVKHMGSLGDRTDYVMDLYYLPPFTIPNLETIVTFNYQIMNIGSQDNDSIENILQHSATSGLTDTGIQGGDAVGVIVDYLTGLIFTSCDGPVAIDQISATGHLLNGWTGDARVHSETRNYTYSSQRGCGTSPRYSVTWSVFRL